MKPSPGNSLQAKGSGVIWNASPLQAPGRNGTFPMQDHEQACSRRGFLKGASACAAHLALMATPFPLSARHLWSKRQLGEVVAQEPFGRLEEVGTGLYAFISTPLAGDYTTVCNGGIIVGRTGVLVVEAFQTAQGARWIAQQARRLSGRWPTHVLVTHYHGDHTGGVRGFDADFASDTAGGGEIPGEFPELMATDVTRDLRVNGLPQEAPAALRARWSDLVLVAQDAPSEIDLGDRLVHVQPLRGHTPSDLAVDLPEEKMTWCGDLVWNGMFPNYMDATPSQLARSVALLQARERDLYIPGHGPLAEPADYARYVEVLEGIHETAQRARREGWTAQEAGERHRISPNLGEWTLFNPSYFQRAVEAWMMEWEG